MSDHGNPAHAAPLSPLAGAACGLAAAVLYTATNVALKASSGSDPVLVSAVKAWPTVLVCGPLLAAMSLRGQRIATSWQSFPQLILGGLSGQLIGSLGFQFALGHIGLALAVPLNLGALIIGSAVLGHWLLGEPVTRRTVLAILILIAAAVVLSLGSDQAAVRQGASSSGVALGVLATCASGVGYAFFGVTMRKSLRRGLTVPLAMLTSGTTGSILLSLFAAQRLPASELAAVSLEQWLVMTLAGLFNVLAFFLISLALRAIPVVAVNLINASQAAMAAAAGVLLFGEEVTVPLGLGLLLTVTGLVVLGTGRRNPRPNPELKLRPLANR
ncbi:EamA family transporter [Candidatus Laterigemmans baculatus]|uniref:EamA family transporter n=1 Tax=Candidatus Laterigemmans baculatus TaxID=2770505 RepID=UPI0013DA6638|nr:EamA family transporter [Candidatus Laterigemmans baculatus]